MPKDDHPVGDAWDANVHPIFSVESHATSVTIDKVNDPQIALLYEFDVILQFASDNLSLTY